MELGIANILDFIVSGFAAAIAAFVEETVLGYAQQIIDAILGIVPGLS